HHNQHESLAAFLQRILHLEISLARPLYGPPLRSGPEIHPVMVTESILHDVQDNHASVWLNVDLRGDGSGFQGGKGIGDLVFRGETAPRYIEFGHRGLKGRDLGELLPNLSVPAVLQEIRDHDSCEYTNHGDSSHTVTHEENFQGIALIRRLKRQPVHTRSKFYPVAAPLRQPELRGRRERKQIERLPNEVAETLQDLQVRRINQLGYTHDLG